MKKRMFKVTEESMLTDRDMGFCIYCGEEAYGVEPDALCYECESCGKHGVYGLEELLMMGRVEVVEEV